MIPRRQTGPISRSLPIAAALVLSLAAGCDAGPVCVRNSECALEHYCSAGVCAQDCTSATAADDCAAGQACNSFGMCVGGGDAGLSDAPEPDAGLDATSDAGPPCVAAGGTDADGDGHCEDDCDDDDVAVHPGAVEVCTPSAPRTAPVDENCDGAIDEGCGWFLGTPHWSAPLALPGASRPSWVSADGLRLYLTAPSAAAGGRYQPFVATRPSLEEPFASPVPLAGPFATYNVYAVELTADEQTLYFGGTADGAPTGEDIYQTTRASRTADFGPEAIVAGVSSATGNESQPRSSEDGLELVFCGSGGLIGGARRLYRSVRSSATEPFPAPELLTIVGLESMADETPWMSADGLTVWLRSNIAGQTTFFRAHRSARTEATFTDATEITDLAVVGTNHVYPVLSEATGELFFGSSRPWSPTSTAPWRARVCRDGPCPALEPVACPSARRSADGQHCYTATTTTGPWSAALTACGEGHLATVHSLEENTVALSVAAGARSWLGGYDNAPGIAGLPAVPECGSPTCAWAWVTGEPWTYSLWGAGEPNNGLGGPVEHALEFNATRWNDGAGATVLAAVCETETWPSW